jgi:uncharacterized protein (DUF2267 family)
MKKYLLSSRRRNAHSNSINVSLEHLENQDEQMNSTESGIKITARDISQKELGSIRSQFEASVQDMIDMIKLSVRG